MRGGVIIQVELRGVEPVAPPHAVSQDLERGEQELAAGINEPVDVAQMYDLPYGERDHAPYGKLSVLHLDQQPSKADSQSQAPTCVQRTTRRSICLSAGASSNCGSMANKKECAQRRSDLCEPY